MNDLCPPPWRYGFTLNWFAAQTARFTSSGAAAGAAATFPRSAARVPGTVGPSVGKEIVALAAKVACAIAQNAIDARERRAGDFTRPVVAALVPNTKTFLQPRTGANPNPRLAQSVFRYSTSASFSSA